MINYIRLLERLTGWHIAKELPQGADLFCDVAKRMPHLKCEVVFDVGANEGQSTQWFLKRLKGCRVWAFEPVPSCYQALKTVTEKCPRVKTFPIALGEEAGMVSMHEAGGGSRIVEGREGGISVNTLDGFCRERGIERIDYLKIDTEGYDFKVLKGAEGLLRKHAVGLVQVEASVNPENTDHVQLEPMKHYLEALDYRVFGFYDQVAEWKRGLPVLRRINAVFVSSKWL